MKRRPKYIVRSVRAAAGTFLAAATLASATAMGSVPANAARTAPPVVQQDVMRSVAVASTLPQRKRLTTEQMERIEGVRQDLETAVSLGSVTQEQADRFASQVEQRVVKGL